MMRIRTIHALDVDDYDSDEQSVKVRHRPEAGTPIKNQGEGERRFALSYQVCDLLDDCLETQRPSVIDEYDREPLLASRQGRTNKTTLRAYVYRWTRPCAYSSECPHDRAVLESVKRLVTMRHMRVRQAVANTRFVAEASPTV